MHHTYHKQTGVDGEAAPDKCGCVPNGYVFATDRRRIVRRIDRMGERCHRVNPHLLSSQPLGSQAKGRRAEDG